MSPFSAGPSAFRFTWLDLGRRGCGSVQQLGGCSGLKRLIADSTKNGRHVWEQSGAKRPRLRIFYLIWERRAEQAQRTIQPPLLLIGRQGFADDSLNKSVHPHTVALAVVMEIQA
jgi:hypothetical protein